MKCPVVLVVFTGLLVKNAFGQDASWPLGSAVTQLAVGDENAVHCKISTPRGATVFDGFGQCYINIPRVTAEHDGLWVLEYSSLENVLPQTQLFRAQVTGIGAESPGNVNTEVVDDGSSVTLHCRVAAAISSCVFRDPAGRVLHARDGVSEDRFSYGENAVAGTCSLRIQGPLVEDLGLWRCDLLTFFNAHNYAHPAVLLPRLMGDPEVAEAVISEPTLTSQSHDLIALEGDATLLSCSVQSAINYCYFRAPDGTVHNVWPGMTSTTAEYAGAGFQAGECAARLRLLRKDAGAWSCHAGLFYDEQRAQFNITVQGPIAVNQYFDGAVLVVEGLVFPRPPLDYCRFVRSDGIGFRSDYFPDDRYTSDNDIFRGVCRTRIRSPTAEELLPWTVVTRTTLSDEELSDTFTPPVTVTEPEETSRATWWIYVVVGAVVLVFAIVVIFICYRKSSASRESV